MPVEQRMRARDVERIPAHVRDFQVRIARRDAIDLAGDPAQAFVDLVFAAALGQKLHADADAEERPRLAAHRLLERIDHAVDGIEPAPAIGKGADARQHDAIGVRHHGRILRHHDRLVEAGLVRRALERLRGRVQIAGTVIDDGDAHRLAPGSGNRPITSDVCGAVRRLRGAAATEPTWRRRAVGGRAAARRRRSAARRLRDPRR